MPSSHRRYADWTIDRIMREAGEIGSNAAALVEIILREKRHPEQGFRACRGIVNLVGRFPRERVEGPASEHPPSAPAPSAPSNPSSIPSSIANGPRKPREGPAIVHDHIRGPPF
jgi:hypothetical protein